MSDIIENENYYQYENQPGSKDYENQPVLSLFQI
jgi:hypothetical protein